MRLPSAEPKTAPAARERAAASGVSGPAAAASSGAPPAAIDTRFACRCTISSSDR